MWHENADEVQVPPNERKKIVEEVLVEVANKMKRRFYLNDMQVFDVKKLQDNLALVEYPHLSRYDDIDLNLIANQLLQLGGLVMNVNIFVDGHPI